MKQNYKYQTHPFILLIVVDCGQPDAPMNGFVLAFNTSVGSVVVFICDLGFNPVGPELSECLADGTFENDGPICVRKYFSDITIDYSMQRNIVLPAQS